MQYIDGVTKIPEPIDSKKLKERRQLEAKQRQLEREIRKYKRYVAGTQDPDTAKAYRKKLKEKQHELKLFVDENSSVLRRDYSREKVYQNEVDNSGKSDIIKTGTISGGLNPGSNRAYEHAVRYYKAVRNMKTDVKRIAENTEFNEEEIANIKDFVFMQKHDLGNESPEYFYPDYAMAQSWQRLIEGKNIKPHDLTLLKHEKMERQLMQQGYSQSEAHAITEKTYNYAKESRDYYAEIEKHKSKR